MLFSSIFPVVGTDGYRVEVRGAAMSAWTTLGLSRWEPNPWPHLNRAFTSRLAGGHPVAATGSFVDNPEDCEGILRGVSVAL